MKKKIWMQAWLNYHDHDQVLDWHNHSAPYHGYISIEPQDTTTEFGDWEIKMKWVISTLAKVMYGTEL